MKKTILIATAALSLVACNTKQSSQVLITGEDFKGSQTTEKVVFKPCTDLSQYEGQVVTIDPQEQRQTIDGFGGSLTESSAFVLACITPEQRRAVLEELFSEKGANFSAARTVLGSSDFTVEGLYSFDDVENDVALEHFSLDNHKDGFSKNQYPQVKDEQFDVYQLITEVAAIKASQADGTLHLVASPWTAPAWMKDNGMYYDHENRRGGALKKEYYQTFANYFERYLATYREAGVEFWAVTPENEPMGNDGSWESMDFPPAQEAEFIGSYLGPTLEKNFSNVKILCFDQNTFEAGPYTAAIYDDNALSRQYTAGTALHWYGSTVSAFPEVLDSLHALYPDKLLFHTEGCIDNLGRDPWAGVSDPVGFKESGWFNNDSFWWNKEATDWAYSTPFWPEWHPKYAPAHRYAQYIIEGVNHWLTGYIDWNIALDSIGGPTHVNNNCGAEVMIDYQNDIIYFTPYFYVLKQFSLSMRPGDIVLQTSQPADKDIYVCAVTKADGSLGINILNMSKEEKQVVLQIGGDYAEVQMPRNSLKTIFVKL